MKITFSTDCDESMKSSYLLLFVDGSYEVFAVFIYQETGDGYGVFYLLSANILYQDSLLLSILST